MKTRTWLSLALLALAAVVSGCAARSIKQDYQLNPEKGVLLGSITRDGMLAGYRVLFRPLGQEKGFDFVETGCDSIVEPSCYARQDFEAIGLKGDLFAVELPPGDYEVFAWDVVSGSIHVGPSSPISLRYRIAPGRATYVGNFHFTQTARFGLGVAGARVDHSKPFERDFALIQDKYPGLSAHAIDIDELNPPTPALGGSSGKSIAPTPVYLPPVK